MGDIPYAATDKFGLPADWSLLGETTADQKSREAKVSELVREIFRLAVRHFGQERAEKEWNDAANGTGGRPRGSSKPDIDRDLVAEFDRRALRRSPEDRRQLTAEIAREVATDKTPWARGLKKRLGLNEDQAVAIEQRLRRALRTRSQAAAAEELTRRVLRRRMAPSLLG